MFLTFFLIHILGTHLSHNLRKFREHACRSTNIIITCKYTQTNKVILVIDLIAFCGKTVAILISYELTGGFEHLSVNEGLEVPNSAFSLP